MLSSLRLQWRKSRRWLTDVSLLASGFAKSRSLWQAQTWPDRLLCFSFGAGVGDDLMCSTILREWKKRDVNRAVMMTRRPELFLHNPDADHVLLPERNLFHLASHRSVDVCVPWYARYIEATDQDVLIDNHILTAMCAAADLTGKIQLRPYLHLTPAESAFGRFAPLQIAIQSSGLSRISTITNKEWVAERFQAIVDYFSPRIHFVQLGLPQDIPLQNVTDLRGKASLRETAAVLKNSAGFVGLVGFLMHLARAVDCRAVIVYGGREAPSESGYIANLNIANPVPCAPCWQRSRCDFDHRCMREIEARNVILALQQMLDEKWRELPVEERCILSHPPILSKPQQREEVRNYLRNL